ncbi:MAG: adenylate kinase [Muribaculaceae bacterium]|nr:adenylate kinase [Muribaculaceae bacterium]
MLNIVIFGAPGSGKGTQSDKIIDKYHLFHISTGDVLRDNMRRGTELGKVAKGYIDQGQLVPDELIIDLLAQVLDENKDKAVDGVIFDGYPRTIPQAEALEQLLADRGTRIDAVVGLEVPDEELIKRILLRGQLSGRADDNEETARKRLEVYYNQTSPLKAYYEEQGKYLAINGMGTIDGIFDQIRKELDNL